MKKKPEPFIRVPIRSSPNAVIHTPVENLGIYFDFNPKTKVVTLRARPDPCDGGINTYWYDTHFDLVWTVTSAPSGITPKRAREIQAESRKEIGERYGDAWSFVMDACRRWGFVAVDGVAAVTDEEWAFLDELTI